MKSFWTFLINIFSSQESLLDFTELRKERTKKTESEKAGPSRGMPF